MKMCKCRLQKNSEKSCIINVIILFGYNNLFVYYPGEGHFSGGAVASAIS